MAASDLAESQRPCVELAQDGRLCNLFHWGNYPSRSLAISEVTFAGTCPAMSGDSPDGRNDSRRRPGAGLRRVRLESRRTTGKTSTGAVEAGPPRHPAAPDRSVTRRTRDSPAFRTTSPPAGTGNPPRCCPRPATNDHRIGRFQQRSTARPASSRAPIGLRHLELAGTPDACR